MECSSKIGWKIKRTILRKTYSLNWFSVGKKCNGTRFQTQFLLVLRLSGLRIVRGTIVCSVGTWLVDRRLHTTLCILDICAVNNSNEWLKHKKALIVWEFKMFLKNNYHVSQKPSSVNRSKSDGTCFLHRQQVAHLNKNWFKKSRKNVTICNAKGHSESVRAWAQGSRSKNIRNSHLAIITLTWYETSHESQIRRFCSSLSLPPKIVIL